MCGRDSLRSQRAKQDSQPSLANGWANSWPGEGRRPRQAQAGRGARGRLSALGVVVLFSRSSTSVGSQVSAGGQNEAGPANRSQGGVVVAEGRRGGLGLWSTSGKEAYTQKCPDRDGRQAHRPIEGVSGRRCESAGDRGHNGVKVPEDRRAPSAGPGQGSRRQEGAQCWARARFPKTGGRPVLGQREMWRAEQQWGRPAGFEGLRTTSALAPPQPWATAASALLQALALGPRAELKKMKPATAQTHHRAQYSGSV